MTVPRLRRRRAPLVLLASVVFIALTGAQAGATHASNAYSIAREFSQGAVYDGIRLRRGDNNPAGPLNGCNFAFEGGSDPLFQTQWVRFPGGWIEGGTGHQCNSSIQYYFAGYAANGQWNLRFLSYFSTGDATLRWRSLYRDSSTQWWYEINSWRLGGTQPIVSWAKEGDLLEAGMETYHPDWLVGKHTYADLDYFNNGAWTPFSGRDGKSVDAKWGICGTWSTTPGNDTYFYAAQNRSCVG